MDRAKRELLLALAATQYSLVSSRQSDELGITPSMRRNAVKQNWLRPLRRGVHAVAGGSPSKWQPLMAAALAAGPEAVISHRSAAEIHGFHGILADGPELSFVRGSGRQLDGVRIHRPQDLGDDDIEIRRGFRVTVPVRTVIDLAPTVDEYLLGKILDEGAISRLWTAEQVLTHLEELAGRGRRGTNRLRQLLSLRLGEGMPDSRLEQRVFRALRPRVPPFEVHHVVTLEGQRIEMDLAWPDFKIDGEVDGMAVRAASRSKFEWSSHRDNVLQRNGWRIVHFTAQMDDRTMVAEVTPLLLAHPPHALGHG